MILFSLTGNNHPHDVQTHSDDLDSHNVIANRSSLYPGSLICPLSMEALDDVILWYKDGRPIREKEDEEKPAFRDQNNRECKRLFACVNYYNCEIRLNFNLSHIHFDVVVNFQPFYRVSKLFKLKKTIFYIPSVQKKWLAKKKT